MLRVLGTEKLCRQFKHYCSSYVSGERIFIAPMSSVFYVEMGGNAALRIEKLLYEGAEYALKRKAQKVQELARRFGDHVFRVLPLRRKKPSL